MSKNPIEPTNPGAGPEPSRGQAVADASRPTKGVDLPSLDERSSPAATSHLSDLARRPILIFGMDRSGTSLVANLVHRWGAFGGTAKNLTQKGDERNPEGFFEEPGLQIFLEDFLPSLGASFWDLSFEERLADAAQSPEWSSRFQELIEGLQGSGRPWFWKEPLMGVLYPFWRHFLPDANLLVPIRDPYASAISWARFYVPEELRPHCPAIPFNLLRWQRLMTKSLELGNEHGRTKLVSYEDLISDPIAGCRDLADHLNRRYRIEGNPDQQARSMAKAVRQDLARNRSEIPFHSRPDVPAAQKDLYAFLLEKLEDPSIDFDPARYPMVLGWREFMQVFEALIALYRETQGLGGGS